MKSLFTIFVNKEFVLITFFRWSVLVYYTMACPVPTAISNGYYVGAKVSYAAGDVIQYVCNTDYVMSGSPVSVCDATGNWVPASGSLPECSISYFSNSKYLLITDWWMWWMLHIFIRTGLCSGMLYLLVLFLRCMLYIYHSLDSVVCAILLQSSTSGFCYTFVAHAMI